MDLKARHKAGIYALKVLEFREGNRAVVKHPIDKGACVLLPVPDLGFRETGIYVDVKLYQAKADPMWLIRLIFDLGVSQ